MYAIRSYYGGDYGVGALVLDRDHRVWGEGSNAMLAPELDSAAHAEMRALDAFERLQGHPAATGMTRNNFV